MTDVARRSSHWIFDSVEQTVYEGDFVSYKGVVRQVGYIGLALDNKVILEPLDGESESPRVSADDIVKIDHSRR